MTNVKPLLPREDTLRQARARAMARHPATIHQAAREQEPAPVVDLRTRERIS